MISENLEKETKLLEHIRSLKDELKNNPDKVLNEIDNFGKGAYHFMNVGPKKGQIIIDEMKKKEVKVMAELGGYVGYSAILFGNQVKKNFGKYYSLEVNENLANIARELIDIAGLSDTVEIIVGPAAKSLEIIASKHRYLDFIFIDHWKGMYLPDLRALESLDLIVPGTVITADNIIMPGAPEYHQYVNSSPEQKHLHNAEVENVSGKQYLGKWNLLYESRLEEVKTPKGDIDAVEITKCLEYLF